MSTTKLATAFLLLTLAAACTGNQARQARSTSEPPESNERYCRAIPIGTTFCRALAIEAPRGVLHLAVATTDAEREKGLMGVRAVPADEGMMFVFPDAANVPRAFWMKDTITPLDMVFVSTDGIITEIAENVAATKPGTPDSRVARRQGIGRFVIELRAGEAEALGMQPGERLTIPPVAAQ